jgi:hypothetical protein
MTPHPWAHLVAAGRDTGQYTIAEGRNRPGGGGGDGGGGER